MRRIIKSLVLLGAVASGAVAADPVGLTAALGLGSSPDGFAPAWRQNTPSFDADARLERDGSAAISPRLPAATHELITFEIEEESGPEHGPEHAEDTPIETVVDAALAANAAHEAEQKAALESAASLLSAAEKAAPVEPAPVKPALPVDPDALELVVGKRPAVSLGQPWRGWLVNGLTLPSSGRIKSRRRRNFGTPEMVNSIIAGVNAVHSVHGASHRIYVGDLSWKDGGRLSRHKSHQSGRDADVGYYFKRAVDQKSLARATRKTLDAARTWTFIQTVLEAHEAEYIFIDYRLQKPLYEYARDVAKVSEDKLLEYFDYPRGRNTKRGIIRHSRGHADHMHVRVHATDSVGNVRAYVKKHGLKALRPLPVRYKVRRGNTLSRIARRHRVKIKQLTKWNRISRRKRLRIGQKLIVGWRRPKLKGL